MKIVEQINIKSASCWSIYIIVYGSQYTQRRTAMNILGFRVLTQNPGRVPSFVLPLPLNPCVVVVHQCKNWFAEMYVSLESKVLQFVRSLLDVAVTS